MSYYLVQRLQTKNEARPQDAGFDRLFSLEYMGSSEFEWGAIPKALRSIRAYQVAVASVPVTIGKLTKPVFFVAHEGSHEDAARAMEAWASPEGRRPEFYSKEVSGFPEAFRGETDRWSTADAWWAIEANIGWALDWATAKRLADAFNGEAQR